VLEKTEMKYWIDNFHSFYTVINVQISDLIKLKEATKSAQLRGVVTGSTEILLKEITQKYNTIDEELWKKGYFVRSDRVSLKYGKHKNVPYKNLYTILESSITSTLEHSPIPEDIKQLKFYLLPWKNIIHDQEFRVFVYKNRITAISQQHLYTINQKLKELKSEEQEKLIQQWINIIYNYFNTSIINRITHMDSYVMDVAILENDEPYFIEINPFGREYSSGSSLFHWIKNENVLYGEKGIIYVRYVV